MSPSTNTSLFVSKEQEMQIRLQVKFGTMMEVVRACLQAEDLADVADFFSFGTNDLTQMTFGYSR